VAASDRHLALGKDALARKDWARAMAEFEAALEEGETGEALEGLAEAATWMHEVELVFDAYERAYRVYMERGDHLGAGRVATWIGNAHYSYRRDLAVTAGWLERAERLLAEHGPSAERAWLLAFRAHVALLGEHDAVRAEQLLERAAALTSEAGEKELSLVIHALRGLLLVTEGKVPEGMRRLDEASAAAAGGELTDPVALETVCCYQIYACKRVRDFDRAAQWCLRLEDIAREWASESTFAICRTHYADVLLWQGRWRETEHELRLAAKAFGEGRPAAADAYVRMAELRRRQGRLEEAEQVLRDVGHHPLAALTHGWMALDRGDASGAADWADRYLRRISRAERTERLAGLELLVRATFALGDAEGASRALDELGSAADAVGTDPLRAALALCTGLMEGDSERARRSFEDAVDLYDRSGAPYEAARARVELARTLAAMGRHDAAREERQEAERRLRDLGAAAAEGARAGADGLTRRELEILRLLAQGRSNQQIAAELVLSVRTVERHISNVYVKIGASGRTARAAAATYATRLGAPS
jgi:ATP/maltotriose-dependent transcriptional regulator MalT